MTEVLITVDDLAWVISLTAFAAGLSAVAVDRIGDLLVGWILGRWGRND